MAAVISASIKNNLIKIGEFLKSQFNTEYGRKKQHLLYYFKKVKNATEMQIKFCALYGVGAVTDQMC